VLVTHLLPFKPLCLLGVTGGNKVTSGLRDPRKKNPLTAHNIHAYTHRELAIHPLPCYPLLPPYGTRLSRVTRG